MSKSPSIDLLSPREIEVYNLKSRNCHPKLIADMLDITTGCVRKHVENPKKRNNLAEDVAVFRMGIEEGYFPPVTVFRHCMGFDKSKNSKIFMPFYDVCPFCGQFKITKIRN